MEDIDWQGHWQIHAWCLLMGIVETSGHMRDVFIGKLMDLAVAQQISLEDAMLGAKQVLWLEVAFPSPEMLL
jgi:hypothetical protein